MNDTTIEVALCVDCVYADGAGVWVADPGWGGFLPEWENFVFGPVLTDEENEPTEPYFAWTACDGCGSALGGDRWRYVAVPMKDFEGGEAR